MINLSRDIRPISDFKRQTPDFVKELKRTGKPVVLTMNGRAQVVVQDAESYQSMLEIAERVGAISAIQEGIDDVEQGRTMSMDAFEKSMRQKHKALRGK